MGEDFMMFNGCNKYFNWIKAVKNNNDDVYYHNEIPRWFRSLVVVGKWKTDQDSSCRSVVALLPSNKTMYMTVLLHNNASIT